MTYLKLTAAIVLAGAVGIQAVRPERTNPPTDHTRTLVARTDVPPRIEGLLERACRDCHSNETRWPWYSNVAPVSWWVIDHVNHGRSHFNYSDWARYERADAMQLLKHSCDLARNGDMPLPEYRRMHRAATLSSEEVEALCGWVAEVTENTGKASTRRHGGTKVHGEPN